jgi:hypothetical protein
VVRKSAGKRPHGIPREGWKRNIKMDFIIEWPSGSLPNRVTHLQVSQKSANVSRRTVLNPFTGRPSVKLEYLWYFHTKLQCATRHAMESAVGMELTVCSLLPSSCLTSIANRYVSTKMSILLKPMEKWNCQCTFGKNVQYELDNYTFQL